MYSLPHSRPTELLKGLDPQTHGSLLKKGNRSQGEEMGGEGGSKERWLEQTDNIRETCDKPAHSARYPPVLYILDFTVYLLFFFGTEPPEHANTIFV